MFIEGEVPYVTGNGNYNNGGFGNGWEGLIGLALVAALFGGGFGGGFGFGGRGGCGSNCATQADLAAGFASNTIQRGVDDILIGQANMQNWINQGFAGVNLGLERGISTTNYNLATGLCNLGYQTQQGFTGLGSKIDMCCCDLKQINLENRYLNEKQTCDILQNQNANTQRIIDYLTTKENQNLRDENFALRLSASQSKQNAYLLNELRPQAIPAYAVPNPNCCYNPCGCGGNGFNVQ